MVHLVETWLIELLKGTVKVFLNPLLYWFVLLGFITGYRRIKVERMNFGSKIFDLFSEWSHTLKISILFGLLLSLLTLGVGIVLTPEMLIVLSVTTIILSLTFNLTLLSASYTLGATYIVLMFLPFLMTNVNSINHHQYTSMVILIGVFLIFEAIMLIRIKRNDLFPRLILSRRGLWVGQHEIKKLTIIPFFTLIPSGMIVPFADFWPYFHFGEHTFHVILIPFILGFNFKVTGSLAHTTIQIISRRIACLGFIVILIGIGSIYIPVLSLASVLLAIVGREVIFYRQRMNDKKGAPYYVPLDKGLKVLAVIPNGPADRLGVLAGETIIKVNNIPVSTIGGFYEALQNSGASFKLDVIDDIGEVRFLTSAFYESEHHELGIIFPREPYFRQKGSTIENNM